jgi:exocyst complex component 2
MILSLKGEAARSEDMFAHIEEILISVRLAFLNCFLDFAAHLEQIGADLSQRTTKRESWQNGYSNDHQEEQSINAPESVVDPHRQLLMILSNIGYCKDELASELYNKYKYTWLQSRWVSFLFEFTGTIGRVVGQTQSCLDVRTLIINANV